MKINILHAGTCLPDYWGGHHLPHVSIYASKGMTIGEIREEIANELRNGCIMGNTDDALLMSSDYISSVDDVRRADRLFRAAYAAVNRLKGVRGKRKFFMDLEEPEEGDDCYCMAYFILEVVE